MKQKSGKHKSGKNNVKKTGGKLDWKTWGKVSNLGRSLCLDSGKKIFRYFGFLRYFDGGEGGKNEQRIEENKRKNEGKIEKKNKKRSEKNIEKKVMSRVLMIGIVAFAFIFGIILISALTSDEQIALQSELNNLTDYLNDNNYNWLVNYSEVNESGLNRHGASSGGFISNYNQFERRLSYYKT